MIPDSAELGGTIRDLNPEVFSTVCKAMKQIVASTAAAYGCESTVSIEGGFAETTNPPSGVALVRKLAVEEPKAMTLSEEGLPLMGTEDFGYYLKQRPGCFFLCGAMETQRCGLSALPFDGGEGYHPKSTEDTAAERPPAAKRQRSATSHMDIERCVPCDPMQSSTIPGAGWANSLRTNCCPHGTAFDFNDNVLPFVVVSGSQQFLLAQARVFPLLVSSYDLCVPFDYLLCLCCCMGMRAPCAQRSRAGDVLEDCEG